MKEQFNIKNNVKITALMLLTLFVHVIVKLVVFHNCVVAM